VTLTPLGMGIVIAGGLIFLVSIVVGIYFCVFRRAQNKVTPPTAVQSLPPVSAPVIRLVPVQSSAEEVK
jgi:Na+-transporting methylmalonyl-CoA/oxaloacetate decarboxylase gamma subunit